ncbi:PAS domain-containing sensor histidine kinase [Rhodospira trueperi]|uniref:histidine kinase n=1 Tax=Rhodospira trueperi TaxID=69960 RepID=A0A1G7DED7_9PROT|nr:PAS domain S-box protein [Rhodospira trueperi]SDE49912.1 PAS domain S-box-containing protein [Rhodospira trueperi]
MMSDATLSVLVLDHLAEGVLLIDSDGRIVYANKRASALLGRDAGALLGTTFSAPIETDTPVEIAFPHTDGEILIADMLVVALETEGNRLSLVSLRDMTTRYEAEAQLREREATYRAVITYANDGFWLTDRTGKALEVNDTYLRMTGFSREELLGQRPDYVDAEEDAEMGRARLARILKTGGDLFETRHRTRDGGVIDVEVSASFTSTIADGRMFVFIRDITPRKRAEASILAAKTAAEEANRAKSEFLAAMSHDLRTPLNAILGFTEVMQMQTFGPLGEAHYAQYVNDIHDSGALLISLVDDLLDLAKVEAGKYEMHEEPLDVSAVMTLARQQTASMAADAGQTVTIDTPDGLPRLMADRRALVQVFTNLLTNAIKFNRQDGAIRFSAEASETGGLFVRVADEGIGMTAVEIEKALRPFEQVDSAHARKHKGTGLGLFLCGQIMRLFGGRVHVDSTPGVGTTVTLRFPLDRVGPGPEAPEES